MDIPHGKDRKYSIVHYFPLFVNTDTFQVKNNEYNAGDKPRGWLKPHDNERRKHGSNYFDMVFDMKDQKIQMEVRDMLTLIKEIGRWQVVADQFSPYPT
jgi:hypothetical protein